jgi:hypothetical protein
MHKKRDDDSRATVSWKYLTYQCSIAHTSNVKTVKEQTFYKRFTNVPTTNRYETKTSEVIPESAPNKIISIWSRRADSGLNRSNLFSTRQIRERYQNVLDSFPKRYRNVCPFVFDITSTHSYSIPFASCLSFDFVFVTLPPPNHAWGLESCSVASVLTKTRSVIFSHFVGR